EEHYVPARSQRTRSVLTFFASDHATSEMVYASADITKAGQAAEIIAFADYWKAATGADPGLLVFDSQLTTYKILDELSGRNITWLTLRQRGKAELARLAALPASAWTRATIKRAGRYRNPHLHEDTVTLKGISAPVRQIHHPQHRPRPAHPADHQRPRHAGQRPFRPVRRADAHRERAGRLHLRVRPQRATVRRLAQRRPGHHSHRRRRQS